MSNRTFRFILIFITHTRAYTHTLVSRQSSFTNSARSFVVRRAPCEERPVVDIAECVCVCVCVHNQRSTDTTATDNGRCRRRRRQRKRRRITNEREYHRNKQQNEHSMRKLRSAWEKNVFFPDEDTERPLQFAHAFSLTIYTYY